MIIYLCLFGFFLIGIGLFVHTLMSTRRGSWQYKSNDQKLLFWTLISVSLTVYFLVFNGLILKIIEINKDELLNFRIIIFVEVIFLILVPFLKKYLEKKNNRLAIKTDNILDMVKLDFFLRAIVLLLIGVSMVLLVSLGITIIMREFTEKEFMQMFLMKVCFQTLLFSTFISLIETSIFFDLYTSNKNSQEQDSEDAIKRYRECEKIINKIKGVDNK